MRYRQVMDGTVVTRLIVSHEDDIERMRKFLLGVSEHRVAYFFSSDPDGRHRHAEFETVLDEHDLEWIKNKIPRALIDQSVTR